MLGWTMLHVNSVENITPPKFPSVNPNNMTLLGKHTIYNCFILGLVELTRGWIMLCQHQCMKWSKYGKRVCPCFSSKHTNIISFNLSVQQAWRVCILQILWQRTKILMPTKEGPTRWNLEPLQLYMQVTCAHQNFFLISQHSKRKCH